MIHNTKVICDVITCKYNLKRNCNLKTLNITSNKLNNKNKDDTICNDFAKK